MKKKSKKTGLKITLIILCLLYLTLGFFSLEACLENKEIQQMIQLFINQPSSCTYSLQYDMNFCKIENKEYDITPSFFKSTLDKQFYIGNRGDILISLESETKPPLKQILTFYAGGHAALVDENGLLVEITGLNSSPELNVGQNSYNYWLLDAKTMKESFILRDSFLALKVTKASLNKRNIAMQTATSYIGQRYNYTFLFNTKKTHYCTDIVSKAYQNVDINLNKDGFITTTQDLVLSQATQIFLYKEINKKHSQGTHNIYYLDDGIEYDFDEFLTIQ